MNQSWDRHDAELDRLLAAYRDACPAPEAGAGFMPQLWERIDARQNQNWTSQLWKWANGMVAAAAAASLFFVMLQFMPKRSPEFYGATYLETLAEQQDAYAVLDNVAVLNPPPARELPLK